MRGNKGGGTVQVPNAAVAAERTEVLRLLTPPSLLSALTRQHAVGTIGKQVRDELLVQGLELLVPRVRRAPVVRGGLKVGDL